MALSWTFFGRGAHGQAKISLGAAPLAPLWPPEKIDRTKEKDDVVPRTMLELAKFLQPYKLAFQELYRLVCIALK